MARVIELALEAARMKSWPHQLADGDVKVEIPTDGGRSQVVVVTTGTDGDGEPVGFVWSKAGEIGKQDSLALLSMNSQLTYAKIAVRGQDIVLVQGIHDATATLIAVGKLLYWTAKGADELETTLNGTADRL